VVVPPPEGVPPSKQLETALADLMHHQGNASNISCLHNTFAQSSYKASYDQCGKPHPSRGQWVDPQARVRACLPKAFDTAQWNAALSTAPAGSDLRRAGATCARLWSATFYILINQVIMGGERNLLDRMMPFIRCLNEYLYSGAELTEALTVFRGSRMTAQQAANIQAGKEYRIGMYVATSTNEAVAGAFGAGCVFWHFTIPARCLQVRDIRTISHYAAEEEIMMVPYTAVRIEHKQPRPGGGETIYATVLRDARGEAENLRTILA